jgi:hypothetical protein
VLSLHPGIVNSLVVPEDRYSWRKSSNVRVLSLMAVLVVVAIQELQQQRETLSSLFLSNMKLLLLKDYVKTQTNKRTPRASTDEGHKHVKNQLSTTPASRCASHLKKTSLSLPPAASNDFREEEEAAPPMPRTELLTDYISSLNLEHRSRNK